MEPPRYVYVRQKRKPPKGKYCDMSVGVDTASHQPHVIRCKNAATVEFKGGPFPWETWVCEAHATKLEAGWYGGPLQ